MSKYVKRLIPFGSGDIPEVQKWLENMSAKGLHFVESGILFAKFSKGESREMRYRLDFCDVVACNIPDEKKELYEANGWHVAGDFKSDCVVVYTDDPEAPEIFTDTQRLAKPLKKLSIKYLAYWIAALIMLGNTNVGSILAVIEDRWNMVNYLLEYGTVKFIAVCLMVLVLAAEAVSHFIGWIRLKKLSKRLAAGGEMPQGKTSAFRMTAGKILTPLGIPIMIIWFIHFFIFVASVKYGVYVDTVQNTDNLPFPMLEELSDEYKPNEELTTVSESNDLLANSIIECWEYETTPASPNTSEWYVSEMCYRLNYYDFKNPRSARSYVDGELKNIVSVDPAYIQLGGKVYDVDADGELIEVELPVYKRSEYELNGASIICLDVCYEESGGDVDGQYLLVSLEEQVVKVYYSGPDDIKDFAQMYVDRLKSAK